MTAYLRVQSGIAVEAYTPAGDKTIADCFTAEVAAMFKPANGASVGDVWNGTAFVSPSDPPPSVSGLLAYAENKQLTVLGNLTVSHTLADASATLDTKCDATSITFMNSLGTWVALNGATNPAPTRVYYNLDGSSHQVTPVEMGEFLNVVGARIQATFDAKAAVRSAINAAPPTITTIAQVDAYAWPTA